MENIKRKRKDEPEKKKRKKGVECGVWDDASQNKTRGVMSQNQAGKGTERGSVPERGEGRGHILEQGHIPERGEEWGPCPRVKAHPRLRQGRGRAQE